MRQAEFARAKEAFEKDQTVTRPLLDELATVDGYLIRNAHLPASFAPYGQWDQEAADELLGEWVGEKLLRRGGLAAILDAARTAKAFRALAQRSLRQFVLNRRERTQSQNLYERSRDLLGADDRFVVVQDAARPQDILWGLAADPPRAAFSGGDHELGGIAYSLGDFELIHYKSSAAKLSPLLSSSELARFIDGMIAAAGPLTVSALMHALELRFDLAPVAFESLQTDNPPEPVTHHVESLAGEFGCSVGTVANEEKAIAEILKRYCDGAAEEAELLKKVGDLLYENGVGDE